MLVKKQSYFNLISLADNINSTCPRSSLVHKALQVEAIRPSTQCLASGGNHAINIHQLSFAAVSDVLSNLTNPESATDSL